MPETLQRTFYQQQIELPKASYLRKKDRETVGSNAFNLEYDAPPTRDELRADVVSYLGEYRLQVQKYDYGLVFGRDKDNRGPISLRDQNRGESMQYKTKRVIEERSLKSEPIHREEAEDRGLALLNERLRFAKTGDTVLWASPPGPKDQGYGDYGFIYTGKVTKHASGEAHLAMTAIRVEEPGIADFNEALTALTGERVEHKEAEEFLATPRVVKKNIGVHEIEGILQSNFDFEADPDDKRRSAEIIEQMNPLIEAFIDVMQDGDKKKKVTAFHALENYALELKQESEKGEVPVYRRSLDLDDLSDRYGYEPPFAKGSCGMTGGGRGNGMISAGMGGNMRGGGSKEWFTCPKSTCKYKASGPVGNTCPGCGLTKEAYAKESGVSCD